MSFSRHQPIESKKGAKDDKIRNEMLKPVNRKRMLLVNASVLSGMGVLERQRKIGIQITASHFTKKVLAENIPTIVEVIFPRLLGKVLSNRIAQPNL